MINCYAARQGGLRNRVLLSFDGELKLHSCRTRFYPRPRADRFRRNGKVMFPRRSQCWTINFYLFLSGNVTPPPPRPAHCRRPSGPPREGQEWRRVSATRPSSPRSLLLLARPSWAVHTAWPGVPHNQLQPIWFSFDYWFCLTYNFKGFNYST